MKANEIITVLNHFKNSSFQKVLINGDWGIGKTKYVSDFIEGHSNACYVSLFGKRDVNSIIQEIYFRIIESAPKGKLKKHWSLLRKKMDNLDISYLGISLSIPIIENIHNALNKELGRKDTYIIVLDDLERKHDELNIKEVFGMIDSLSKIENIKTVLIAATDQLEGENKDTFISYQEKAIDRIYTIEEYADEAPLDILGEQVWQTLGILVDEFKFNNLRTFEKADLFIKEVIQILGEKNFTDKFTRDDIYRMCFASVFFKIEHKSEMILLDTDKPNSHIHNALYTSDENGVVEYLYKYILKNSLDNIRSKSVLYHIWIWYKSGAYHEDVILELIDSINNFEEKPKNFYSSDDEILEIIEHTRDYMRNIDGTEKLDDIIYKLNTAFAWCEVLSVDFGKSNTEILCLINKNISKNIDLSKSCYQNEIDLWSFHVENEKAREFVKLVNEVLKVEYHQLLIKKIRDSLIENSYGEYRYLNLLENSINTNIEIIIRSNIIEQIREYGFLFPMPSGRITEEQWYWCRIINKVIKDIERYWDVENFYDDFKSYIYSFEITDNEKILQHRLKILIEG